MAYLKTFQRINGGSEFTFGAMGTGASDATVIHTGEGNSESLIIKLSGEQYEEGTKDIELVGQQEIRTFIAMLDQVMRTTFKDF